MSLQLPRADKEGSAGTIRFNGVLKNLELEKRASEKYGDSQQIKFTIQPTSYKGKERFEWYTLTELRDSKYGKLMERLGELGLYKDGVLADEVARDKEYEWEQVDNEPTWPAVKCRECDASFSKANESRRHREETKHKLSDAGYLLPVKIIGSTTATTTAAAATPGAENEIERAVLTIIEASGPGGIAQTELVSELESMGYQRIKIVPVVLKMRKGNRVSEREGRLLKPTTTTA